MDEPVEQQEFDRTAKPWLDMLHEAEQTDKEWHQTADNVDKSLGDLKKLAKGGDDREFQIFYANFEVLKNVVYSRPPVPVVTPRFRDRKPLPRAAADMLERALITDAVIDGLHDTLMLARDDMLAPGRGVVWVDFTMRRGAPAPVARHLNRQDFRHGTARKWAEVPWVAKRAWMTRGEVLDRFGAVPEGLKFEKQSLGQAGDEKRGARKAEIWELWHKAQEVVVWVSPGVEEVLDVQPPIVTLEGFFPCPKPAYAQVQRDTLIPLPDALFYKDQIEEINELTARISSLSESLRMRGFYPGGQGDIAESVEKAIRIVDDRAVLIPVANYAALGGQALKDSIIWLPLNEVASTLAALVELRKQLIQDVYEITGLSDIMRGATQASETATAQQIKAQYGSIRAQSRQMEMQRLARDVIAIKAEIMAENCAPEQLLEWSQVDMPSVADLQQQAQAAMMQGVPPQEIQQTLANAVTVDAVLAMLREQRTRPFILEIETDSTIQANEDAEKQRRTEFLTAIGGLMQQAVGAMQIAPQLGPFLAESLRFAASGFRAGRSMDTAIDDLAEQLANFQPPQQENGQAEAAKAQADVQMKQAEMQMRMQEAQAKAQTEQAKAGVEVEKMRIELAMTQQETAARIRLIDAQIQKIMAEIGRTEAQAEAAKAKPKEMANG